VARRRPSWLACQTYARNAWTVRISEAYLSRESKELDPFVTEAGSEPWRTGDAERAAREALHALGRAGAELRLVRLGENALFHAPALEALLRVARPQKSPKSIAHTVAVARRLRAEGVPAPEPLTFKTLEQPFVSSSGTVTVWRYYRLHWLFRVTAGLSVAGLV
jgi:hypothetical protein